MLAIPLALIKIIFDYLLEILFVLISLAVFGSFYEKWPVRSCLSLIPITGIMITLFYMTQTEIIIINRHAWYVNFFTPECAVIIILVYILMFFIGLGVKFETFGMICFWLFLILICVASFWLFVILPSSL